MERFKREALAPFAIKYLWWKSLDEALDMPERVIAQVMNFGEITDVQSLAALVGDEVLREVLMNAQAGQFNLRSWSYWHYRLGLSSRADVPALPVRKFPHTSQSSCLTGLPTSSDYQ